MELQDITKEQWEDAVDASIDHCEDGKYRTEESYQSYNNRSDACALCELFARNDLQKYCPLYNPSAVNIICSCCEEWRAGSKALRESKFFTFHTIYISLVNRLKDVRARGYEAWRDDCLFEDSIEEWKRKHVWQAGDYFSTKGQNMRTYFKYKPRFKSSVKRTPHHVELHRG